MARGRQSGNSFPENGGLECVQRSVVMKIKFNRYERIAGIFVLTAFVGGTSMLIGVAIQRGLFQSRIELQTALPTADGVREGTPVSIQGLRVGKVSAVELVSGSEVTVRFLVNREYQNQIRTDSVVRVTRPFLIGEKVLEVSVGSIDAKPVGELAVLEHVPTMDMMDLLSGRTLGPQFELLGRITENLKFVAEAFLDPKRSQALVRMFDELAPLMKNASSLTKEANVILKGMNRDQQLVTMMGNLAAITGEVHRLLPQVAKESPEMLTHLAKIAKNMAILTDEVQKTLPAMQALAPEIPRASQRALEALDQTVVTLKALQKSFLLRGSVREVREEEALAVKAAESARKPASPEKTEEEKP